MKKIIFSILCAVIAISANAQLKFKSLNNYNGETTVVVEDNSAPADMTDRICCAQFTNDGKTYDAKSMVCKMQGNKATVTLTFKHMTVFNNMAIILNVDDKATVIPIDLLEVARQLNPAVKLLME